ncbi:MAG: hypothetical protein K6F46_09405 [Desulfovibrio sp.]|nr:hypothetical protein [Desulfovibrio sp.]
MQKKTAPARKPFLMRRKGCLSPQAFRTTAWWELYASLLYAMPSRA